MELAVVPIYQSEIVPKEVRGLVVGTYQLMLYFGGLIMSLTCYGTSRLEGNKQWQIPFSLFFIIPTIVASGTWFIPEVSLLPARCYVDFVDEYSLHAGCS